MREALIASLIAALDTNRGKVPLIDEDFKEDPEGDWYKTGGTVWSSKEVSKLSNRAMFVPMHFGKLTEWDIEARQDADEYDAKVDAAKSFSRVTTFEQRLVRYATQRADEIINAS